MPIRYTKNDNPCNLLLMYQTKTEEIEAVELEQEFPGQIVEYKNRLIIMHIYYNYSYLHNCSVGVYNLDDGEVENYKVQGLANQVTMKDNDLYALDLHEQTICVYNLECEREELELVEKYTLKSKEGKSVYRYYMGV